MAVKRKSPRLLKKVKQNSTLHLEHAFKPIEKKELTKEEQIYQLVTETCEEHYLLTDSECGLSLIDDKECVKAIEGTENGYLLKFRMEVDKSFACREFAIKLSHKLNCLRRFFMKKDSVTYPGVSRPIYFLECAMVLEDNRGKEPIDRSEEVDEDEFLFEWKKRRRIYSEDNIHRIDMSDDEVKDNEEEHVREVSYDGTQTEEEVDAMLADTEVILTEESYADADEVYANFA